MFIESLSPDQKITLPVGLFLVAKEFEVEGGGGGVNPPPPPPPPPEPIKYHANFF